MFLYRPAAIMLSALLAALCLSKATGAVEVGSAICVEGYVMDLFCIDRGTLLDNSRVTTLIGPEQHSVHCLVDVASCIRTPYELLLPPLDGERLWARGWRLDDATKERVLVLARDGGRCSTCDEGYGNPDDLTRGLHVAIDARVLDMGSSTVPATISGVNIVISQADQLFCGSGKTADDEGNIIEVDGNNTSSGGFFSGTTTAKPPTRITTSGSNLEQKYYAHGSLMLIGWGWLLPSGTLFARFFKHRPNSLWFKIHRVLQSVGLFLSIVGWIIALRNFNVFEDRGYDSYRHGVLGMVTMTLGCLQPLNAILRPHPTKEGEEKTTARLVWELLHKSTGYIAVLLAVVTIGYGTTVLPFPDDQKTFQLAYGLGCGGMLTVLFLALQTDRIFYKGDEDDAKAGSTGEKQTMVPEVN
jgi:hypothetical protein